MITLHHSQRFNRLPDAVLFDIDNTLYAYDPAHEAALGAVRDKVAMLFSIAPEDVARAFAAARQEVKSRLGETASSHSRLLYMQRMLELLGLGSQALLALDFEQTYWRTFLAQAALFDEVHELLDDLRLLGIPTAIVTDLTAQIQFRKLVYFGLDRYFDYIVTSEEAGHDKPHPAPFTLALTKLQPKGTNVWMIGDSAKNDIFGARQAIQAVTLQKLHAGVEESMGEQRADASFRQYAELRNLLRSLEKRA